MDLVGLKPNCWTFLQCFDAVGWVIWPLITGPQYDIYVFCGTLNLAQLQRKPHLCDFEHYTAPPIDEPTPGNIWTDWLAYILTVLRRCPLVVYRSRESRESLRRQRLDEVRRTFVRLYRPLVDNSCAAAASGSTSDVASVAGGVLSGLFENFAEKVGFRSVRSGFLWFHTP